MWEFELETLDVKSLLELSIYDFWKLFNVRKFCINTGQSTLS